MTRYITSRFLPTLAILLISSALSAAPRYARVMMGSRELVMSPRAVVDDGQVYVTPSILKQFNASYVTGEQLASVAIGDRTVDLDISPHNNVAMLKLADVADALDAGLSWDEKTSTARLMSKLVSVEYSAGVLTAKLTLPAAVSSPRVWSDPWRLSFDLAGVKVATPSKVLDVAESAVTQVRVGQFNDDTARIAVNMSRKLSYSVLTSGLSKEIKVLVGGSASNAPTTPVVKPVVAPHVSVSEITASPEGDTGLCVRISTSGKAVYTHKMSTYPMEIELNIQNASLDLDEPECSVDHPLLRGISSTQDGDKVLITLDLRRYVTYTTALQGDDIVIKLGMPMSAGGSLADKTIVVDAGHGGPKAGASYGGVKEKDLNLAIAKQVKAALEAAGATVIMTRDSDVDVDNVARPAIATRYGADMFVSIHCNAIGIPDRLTGIETLYNPYHQSSCIFAETVHKSLIAGTGMKDGKTRARPGLAVLKYSRVPAILVECGYLDCSADRKKLCDDSYRTRLAQALVAGIRAYVEGRASTGGN